MAQTLLATDLIPQIYAAVSGTGSWNIFLESVAAATRASCGGFYWRDFRHNQFNVMALHNMSDDYVELYTKHYASADEWINRGSSVLRTGWVSVGQALCSDEDLQKSEFHNDFLSKFDLFHQVGGIVTQQDSVSSAITLLRPKRKKRFEDESAALLSALIPHLQQALAVRQKVLALESRNLVFEHALNVSSTAIIFVDRELRVLWRNQSAIQLLDKKNALLLKGRQLSAPHPADSRRLKHAVELAQQHQSQASIVPISKLSGQPISVSVAPGRSQPFAEFNAAAVLFVSDPDASVTSVEMLQGLFNLTPAEARVTAKLVHGERLHDICDSLAISYATARAHLRSIFQKVGVRRQSELVSQVLRATNHRIREI